MSLVQNRILKIRCLLYRIQSLLYGSFAKEPYNLKEPTNRSHPIYRSIFLHIHPIKHERRCEHISRCVSMLKQYWFGHDTGWRRLIGCLKLQVIFRKRATNYRALLRKLTYGDKASYDSTPPYDIKVNVYISIQHIWERTSYMFTHYLCTHDNIQINVYIFLQHVWETMSANQYVLLHYTFTSEYNIQINVYVRIQHTWERMSASP